MHILDVVRSQNGLSAHSNTSVSPRTLTLQLSDRASSLLNNAIKKGVQMGYFTQPKGPSGPIKLDKVKAKSLLAPPKPLGSAYNKKITAKKHKTISKPSKKSQNKSKPVLTSSLKTKKHSLKPSASHPSKAPSHATSMKKTTSSKAVSAQKVRVIWFFSLYFHPPYLSYPPPYSMLIPQRNKRVLFHLPRKQPPRSSRPLLRSYPLTQNP